MSTSVGDLIERALIAYEELGLVGEEVVDEWQYVTDLGATWRSRLEEVGQIRGGEIVPAATAAAIERAIEEIGRIDDPHRAIDWLSTFPQLALLALGERP